MPRPSDKLKPGDRAPDFVLPDHAGRQHRLSEHLKRGPLALIFIRGTW